ncbi:MAG: hypothetical protein IT558_02240 [Alphaproteobacteria bacterium]|nr:hypothetical protein [Alphaproteobacteria bacterium]
MTGPESLQEDYAASALEQVRAAVKGNGVKTDHVKIESFSGQVSVFPASVKLTLRHKISEKNLPGKKVQGVKTDSAQGARSAADKERQKAMAAPEMLAKIKSVVLERDDKGCGLKNEIVKLPFLDKEFYWHEACRSCGSKGEIACPRCRGQKFETCPKCHGQKQETCPACRGARNVHDHASGGMRPCQRCNGHGRVDCRTCLQAGKIPCPACRGQGATPCQNCGGEGWRTHVLASENEAAADFEFDHRGLSENAVKLVEGLGPHLAEQAEIAVLPESSPLAGENAALDYEVRFAHGEANIALGEKGSALILLQGKEGMIGHAPHFLEALIRPGIDKLEKAAQEKKGSADMITEAAKYKTVRHAVLAAAKYPRAKAVTLLLKNTPVGLGEATGKAMVDLADRALKNLTAKSSLRGLAGGTALAGILYALYMDTPLRKILVSFIPRADFQPAVDVMVFLMGVFIATETIRYAGAGAMKKALSAILPEGTDMKILPRAGGQAVLAALICALLFTGAAELAVHANSAAPAWYVSLRQIAGL